MNKMKHKLTIVVLYMIISSCNNTDSNEFAFSNYSWECPKEGGKEIFTSNKEEWEIDQLILDGIIIKEYSPEYIDKNQSFPPDKFEFDFFLFIQSSHPFVILQFFQICIHYLTKFRL